VAAIGEVRASRFGATRVGTARFAGFAQRGQAS
jgi:hypothetical protein